MTTYRYIEPDETGNACVVLVTEEEIARDYWPWWSEKMLSLGRGHLISMQSCIEDWVVGHWAEAVG